MPAAPPAPPPEDTGGLDVGDRSRRLTVWVRGRVQGVGFRWWVRTRALELGLIGWAANLDDGRVEVVAEGPESACRHLLMALQRRGPPGRVAGVVSRWSDPRGNVQGFAER